MAPMIKFEQVVKKMMTVFARLRTKFMTGSIWMRAKKMLFRKPFVTKFMALFNSHDLSDDDKAEMLVTMIDTYSTSTSPTTATGFRHP